MPAATAADDHHKPGLIFPARKQLRHHGARNAVTACLKRAKMRTEIRVCQMIILNKFPKPPLHRRNIKAANTESPELPTMLRHRRARERADCQKSRENPGRKHHLRRSGPDNSSKKNPLRNGIALPGPTVFHEITAEIACPGAGEMADELRAAGFIYNCDSYTF